MEDQGKDPNSLSQDSEKSEPVRSRWTPKPEQILILESIFNSGMVNPPKNETIRIRKLLEKFGSVGDANVFYWFQNRRSRSRRRQRQMQANMAGNQTQPNTAIQCESNNSTMCFPPSSQSSYLVGSSSGGNVAGDGAGENIFSFSGQMGFPEMNHSAGMESILYPPDISNLHYQSGLMRVFINGVETEVPKGPIEMKSMFGEDVVLLHSSGVPLPVNEYGFLTQSLQHGESYFLVSMSAK